MMREEDKTGWRQMYFAFTKSMLVAPDGNSNLRGAFEQLEEIVDLLKTRVRGFTDDEPIPIISRDVRQRLARWLAR